jgi:uncharacterized phage protein (TIGR02220 family)
MGLHADVKGFVEPSRVARLVGINIEALKPLVDAGYIILFNSGVAVIKHWNVHNSIREDREAPTRFQEELKLISLADNGAYILREYSGSTPAQNSIVEYSIDKNNNNIYRSVVTDPSPPKKIKKQEKQLTEEQLMHPLRQYNLSQKQLESIAQKELEKIIQYLNESQGRRLSTINAKALNNYKKIRLDYSKKEVITSINNAHDDQYHVSTKYKYLTPEFLFRQDKFEKFLIK